MLKAGDQLVEISRYFHDFRHERKVREWALDRGFIFVWKFILIKDIVA